MDIQFYPTYYDGGNYLSRRILKLFHVSKRPLADVCKSLSQSFMLGYFAIFQNYLNLNRTSRITHITLQPSNKWCSLRWRHNGRSSDSNHQPHGCLLNRLFRRRSRKTSKLRVTGLCVGNSPGTGEFSAKMASNAENVSIWWRHHVKKGQQVANVHALVTSKSTCF